MVWIEINGKRVEVDKNLTILDTINLTKEPYVENCKVITIKKSELIPKTLKDFSVETTKGKFQIRITDSALPFWLMCYQDFQQAGVGWISKDVVTFGPIDFSRSKLRASREKLEYHRWDVFLSFGGFDPSRAYLCFGKSGHEGVYGSPQEHRLIGGVTSGGHVVLELDRNDSILQIRPSVTEREEVVTLGPDEIKKKVVEDGIRILTHAEATLYPEAASCAEHFLASIANGFFEVDQAGTAFICSEKLVGADIQKENLVYRSKGAITVRNSGIKTGAVYIYRRDSPFVPSHSLVGKITKGIELVEHANPGDRVLLRTIPDRLMLVGMTQSRASEYLAERGIKHIRVGNENDDAVIIEQRPQLTMEVKEQGSASTLGVDPELIVRVNLWGADSPRSVMHFKKVADMIHSPIGKLQVLGVSDEMLILSSSKGARTIKSIPPEKSPSDVVEEGIIGVTNSLRRLTGVIGIRLKASDGFGPTGEAFEGTNLIGKVIQGLDLLKNRNVGDVVYLMER